jgi:hypothetical protein
MSPMTILLLALALAQAQPQPQEPPKPPPKPEDIIQLQQRIAEREARRAPLEHQIREAVDKNETEAAQRLNQEFKENEKELDALKLRLADAKAARGVFWTDNVVLSGQALLTRWDNALGLDNSFGWGTSLRMGKNLSFEYQRWETRDNIGRAGATVQSYELLIGHEQGIAMEGAVTFSLTLGVGLAHFSSDATRCDSGPIVSLRPEWHYYYNPRASFGIGGDFDFVSTDFNQAHTHARQNQSLLFSIDLAF